MDILLTSNARLTQLYIGISIISDNNYISHVQRQLGHYYCALFSVSYIFITQFYTSNKSVQRVQISNKAADHSI